MLMFSCVARHINVISVWWSATRLPVCSVGVWVCACVCFVRYIKANTDEEWSARTTTHNWSLDVWSKECLDTLPYVPQFLQQYIVKTSCAGVRVPCLLSVKRPNPSLPTSYMISRRKNCRKFAFLSTVLVSTTISGVNKWKIAKFPQFMHLYQNQSWFEVRAPHFLCAAVNRTHTHRECFLIRHGVFITNGVPTLHSLKPSLQTEGL